MLCGITSGIDKARRVNNSGCERKRRTSAMCNGCPSLGAVHCCFHFFLSSPLLPSLFCVCACLRFPFASSSR